MQSNDSCHSEFSVVIDKIISSQSSIDLNPVFAVIKPGFLWHIVLPCLDYSSLEKLVIGILFHTTIPIDEFAGLEFLNNSKLIALVVKKILTNFNSDRVDILDDLIRVASIVETGDLEVQALLYYLITLWVDPMVLYSYTKQQHKSRFKK